MMSAMRASHLIRGLSIVPVTLAASVVAGAVDFNDGEHLFGVQDDTISDTGRVGIWTKPDSVTLLVDFRDGTGN